jgi:thiol-disulfide isomerase/thioredoxin
LPRYQFTVGEELVYSYRDRNVDEHLHQGGRPSEKLRSECVSQWRVWVIQKNRDGSWRLVLDRAVRTIGIDKHVEISRRMLAYCDIFADGRIVANPTLGNFDLENINPSWLFVSLPASREAMAQGWPSPNAVGNSIFHCSVDPNTTGPLLLIRCTQKESVPDDGSLSKTRQCTFDLSAGRLRQFQEESTGDFGQVRWQCQATTKLESVTKKPAQWIEELRQEAEKFFAVQADHQKRAEVFHRCRTVKECEARLSEARQRLATAQQSAHLEPVQAQYTAALTLHDEEAKRDLRNAHERQEVYSAGPAAWELKDFDGTSHRLKDYRGKIVVLDFWYRGCGWCIKAMPQINQVAENYKGKGVVVLGMNTDEEDEDALFVIRREHPQYANLKAGSTKAVYHPNHFGYPSMYILDREGRVRHIQIGFSPDLAKRLGNTIDGLLREPPQHAE